MLAAYRSPVDLSGMGSAASISTGRATACNALSNEQDKECECGQFKRSSCNQKDMYCCGNSGVTLEHSS